MSTLKTGALRGTSGSADSIQLHATNQSVTFPGNVTVTGTTTLNGTVTGDNAGALVFVGEQTLSGSTDTTINVEDTALFDGTYDQVLIRITDHHPNTDESMFIARCKYGGSYQTTSHYVYNTMIWYEDSYAYMSSGSAAANNHSHFRMGKQIGNAAGESYCCDFWIDSPADTVNYKLFRWYPTYVRTSVQIMHGFGGGMYTNSTTGQGALQGVQFGNEDSGGSAAQLKDIKIRKYGFKKS